MDIPFFSATISEHEISSHEESSEEGKYDFEAMYNN